ncbi:hypothetical protein ACJJTC_008759 [Scirpophaga incertulas]
MVSCAGCLTSITTNQAITCRTKTCKKAFHLPSINSPQLLSHQRKSWTCPDCRAATRKTETINELEYRVRGIVQSELKSIPENIAGLEKSISFVMEEYDQIKKDLFMKVEVIKRLENENFVLNGTIRDITYRLDNMEQQTRSCNLEIQCVSDFKNENLPSVIGTGSERKPIFVAEHFSPMNRSLHAVARMKAKKEGYKFVWVKQGKVFVLKNEASEHIYKKIVVIWGDVTRHITQARCGRKPEAAVFRHNLELDGGKH